MQEDSSASGVMFEAMEAARELGVALAVAGVKFPSLSGDVSADLRPHVELGGVPAETARTLASWIRERATESTNASE
jgi:hypothetical protein